MKITFVQHSCFMVELEQCILIFDWFDATTVKECSFHGELPEFSNNKKIYVFASHKHKDHFDLKSLRWIEKFDDITYILSKDIRLSDHYLIRHEIPLKAKERVLFVKPWQDYEIDDLQIHTLNSTDAGVAFYVKVNETSFYHAGDLNNWFVEEDPDKDKMRTSYESEISYLKDKNITASFIVLDPRLKKHALDGINYFYQNIKSDYIFPMHMWRDYSYILTLKERIFSLTQEETAGKKIRLNQIENIVDIRFENQEFLI